MRKLFVSVLVAIASAASAQAGHTIKLENSTSRTKTYVIFDTRCHTTFTVTLNAKQTVAKTFCASKAGYAKIRWNTKGYNTVTYSPLLRNGDTYKLR